MARTLGRIIREAMASIGLPPNDYNVRSFSKMRARYEVSQVLSMTGVMFHDGRSSGAEGVPYARRATAGQPQGRTRD